MGGRGKTPLVALVARRLLAAGERPAILSRGYGRRTREDGVVIVSDGTHLLADLDRAGDEPLLLARQVPGAAVLVCEQRAIAAALASRVLGATVMLLDDGFQHRSMRRDIDLVVIAPGDLHDRRAPFGRLRQPPSALGAADALIVDGALDEADRSRFAVPVFPMTRALGEPHALEPFAPPPDRRAPVVAVAGIARPDRFQRALEAAGWTVARLLPFADHHRYTPRDLERMARAVADTGAAGVVTTEKDGMRLAPLRPLPVPIAAVPLTIDVQPADAFDAWLLGAVRDAAASAGLSADSSRHLLRPTRA